MTVSVMCSRFITANQPTRGSLGVALAHRHSLPSREPTSELEALSITLEMTCLTSRDNPLLLFYLEPLTHPQGVFLSLSDLS